MKINFRLPNDCKGDGFDIAVAKHTDNLSRGESNKLLLRSKIYACGSFCGYIEKTFEPTQKSLDLIKKTKGNCRFSYGTTEVKKVGNSGFFFTKMRYIVSGYDKNKRKSIGENKNLVIEIGTYIRDYKGWNNCPVELPEIAKNYTLLLNNLARKQRRFPQEIDNIYSNDNH